MKNLRQIIQGPYRIIDFNNQPGILSKENIEGDKYLTILKSKNPITNYDGTVILDKNAFINAIGKNSSDVIILNVPGFHELKALQRTHEAIYFFERITFFNLIFIFYFFVKNFLARHQKYYGLFYLKKGKKISFYLGLKRWRPLRKRTRHYLSPLVTIEDFFQNLNEQNIKYCILRWFDNLPDIDVNEDIDLLVEDNDLENFHRLIDARPGIVPFDVYSKTGEPGSDFQGLPYYALSLAKKALNETVLYKNSFKVPTQENYFYLLAYHAVFHKGENSGLSSKQYKLKINNNPDHDYLYHLRQIASKMNLQIDKFTLEGLHSFLELKGLAPPLDAQYKLSLQNQYLKAYLGDTHRLSTILTKYKGLVCFVVREKIVEDGLLDELKRYIRKEGFTILKIYTLEEPYKSNFKKKVRGGNWNQGPWPVSGGLPAIIIVALDVYPIPPTPDDHDQHPGITNRRIRNKTEIRDFLNQCLPEESRWFNSIHSSDNEIQAIEYLTLAGLDENEIYEEMLNHKQAFVTHHPVLDDLSEYSRRAKVELISYHGKKAVKKTFKPMCERFLANEIEAYSVFRGVLKIPELLEVGDNYIIVSYIEGNKPLGYRNKLLGYRISIDTLKKCLKILRHVYDAGYSLLDFKPGSFLVDGKKDIYLIDFEFLYRYDVKPKFAECYDLAGIPGNLDHSMIPNNHIPKGIKQYDALWYRYTYVKYDELSKLNRVSTQLKSIFRYYFSKLRKLLILVTKEGKSISKTIHKYLP